MTTNQTLYPSAAGLIGNVSITRNILPTIRAASRRLNPDGLSNIPYYTAASGKTLVLSYTTEPLIDVDSVDILLTSNSIAQIIVDINSAVPGVIEAFEQDGFLCVRNLNPGKTHFLTIEPFSSDLPNDAAPVLGFVVSPFPGSTSFAGEYSPSPSNRKESNPQTTALISSDEDLSSKTFNRAFYAVLQLVETMRADLARDVVVYKDVELSFSAHATDGIISARINDDSIRVFVPPFDSGFSLPIAAFRLNKFHRVLNTSGEAAVQDFHAPGDPTGIFVSNFFYATAGTPFTPSSLFSTWGTPNGGSVVGAGESVSNANKHPFTSVTKIVGNIVECASATFVTKKVKAGDPVELVASNLSPFDHSGWFAVDAIIDETHLAIRTMGTIESIPDVANQVKPRWLNPTAGGTLRVAMGRFIPAGDLFVASDQASLVNGGNNHIVRLSVGVPFIQTISEDQARSLSGGLNAVASILSNHMQTSADAHAASAITGFTSATTWRDGTTITGGTIKATIEDILTDLKAQAFSDSGSGRIGAEAISIGGAAPNSLTSGTVLSQLITLLTNLRDHINQVSGAHAASSISYAGGAAWADGTTNPAATVEAQLDKIIVDLGGAGGASKIKYDGGPAWADATTNPATTLELQIDKIITDLGGAGGASKVKYDGGPAWADSTTNPATTVEAQLDKIITDLAASTGSAKVGGAATGTDIAAGTLAAQIANLAVNWLKMGRANTISAAQTFSALLTSAAITANGLITANSGLTTSSGITLTGSADFHVPERSFSIDCSGFQNDFLSDGSQGSIQRFALDGSHAIVLQSLVVGAGNASGSTNLVAPLSRLTIGDTITTIDVVIGLIGAPNGSETFFLFENDATTATDVSVFGAGVTRPSTGALASTTLTLNYPIIVNRSLRLALQTSSTSGGTIFLRHVIVRFIRP